MNGKTALVFGVTGLTGSYLLNYLMGDSRYGKIKIFVRRKTGLPANNKLEEHTLDISSPENYTALLHGDDLFCCLGTTIVKAGSKEAFRAVDYELPVKIAEAASRSGVSSFIVISSSGADVKSSNFYYRTKGEMEEAVQKFSFQKTALLRPSMLLGGRKEFRLVELIGKGLMQAMGFIFIGRMKKYKAIHARHVSKAMIVIANSSFSEKIFESDKIYKIAASN